MQKTKLKDRLRYYFENTMSAGPAGIIKWLGIASLILVLLLGIIIFVFGIKDSPEPNAAPLGFIEGTWRSLMATLDPGTMGGDEGWSFRIVRFMATLGGIFLISILIGAISSGIDEKIEELKKGRSRVLESNHTLILGWSEKVFSIISEIIEANSNQKNPRIVVLADKDKVEMEDEIKSKISDFKNTKIVVRSGSPLESSSVSVANPNDARSIIVLSSDEPNSDTQVIKTVLGLTNGKNRKDGEYHIVAEIKDPKNMEAAELVGNNETIYVLSPDLISRITAQTCRQSGLSVVYSELLQFDGDEIYFKQESELYGKTYKEALFSYEDSSVIGIFTKDKQVLLNPAMETVINEGDSIIAISEDDDTIKLSNRKDFGIQEEVFDRQKLQEVKKERTLILGWNERGIKIIEELDNYVSKGSEVTILSENEEAEAEISELKTKLEQQTLNHIEGNIIDRETLENLKTETYDHIIVLSSKDLDVQECDAKTLICLLHLRNLSEKANRDFSIVSEMLDIRNRELGVVAKADDFIVGDNLISLMLSQLSENKELKKVYDSLFEAEGSEIYLKPVSRYVQTDVDLNFYTVLESAAQLGESAIGYRISALNSDYDSHYGVKINPIKSENIRFNKEDYIIVLAED